MVERARDLRTVVSMVVHSGMGDLPVSGHRAYHGSLIAGNPVDQDGEVRALGLAAASFYATLTTLRETEMLNGKRIAVVMPAYNAAKTLERTVRELPGLVDTKILVDDHSFDETVQIAKTLGLRVFIHGQNYGYGRNQQTCYREALASGADIVVMVHPDYQYTPLLVAAMASMIAFDVYDVVLGSRILGGGALKGGMPLYKYIANRFLTAFQNLFTGAKLSEYHTGLRAFSKEVLMNLPLLENSDDFVFDNEMLAQCINFGYRIGEVSCPTKYFDEASSINFTRSLKYGLGVLGTTLKCYLQRLGIARYRMFSPAGRKLVFDYYAPGPAPNAGSGSGSGAVHAQFENAEKPRVRRR